MRLSPRHLTVLAAFAGCAVLGFGAVASAGTSDTKTTTQRTTLSPGGTSLDPGDASPAAKTPNDTRLLALDWTGDANATFTVQSKVDGHWKTLGDVAKADGGADTGSADAQRAARVFAGRNVSDPIEVKDPSQVRVRVADAPATSVRLLSIATPTGLPDTSSAPVPGPVPMVFGGSLLAVAGGAAAGRDRRRAAVMVLVVVAIGAATLVAHPQVADAAPRMITRAQYGADESLRLNACPEGPNYRRPKLAVIHHTDGSNSYGPGGSAAIARSLYVYFVAARGYCDNGYNFMVDRYGQIFEGRYGGIDKGVIGAHATNFNTGTFGVAMMGSFTSSVPPAATQNALVELLSWKMTLHRINPYLPTEHLNHMVDPIIGHADAGAISGDGTSCPGAGGYSILNSLRARVRPRVDYGSPIGNLDRLDRAPGTVRVRGWAIDPEIGTPISVHVYVDNAIAAVKADRPRPDLVSSYPEYGTAHGFDVTLGVPPGSHNVCAFGINYRYGYNALLGCKRTSGVPIGHIDAVVKPGNGTVIVRGWTIDPDSSASIDVHIWIDQIGMVVVPADVSRPDVGAAFPGYGDLRGFSATVGLPAGTHKLCVWGISRLADPNGRLGCTTV